MAAPRLAPDISRTPRMIFGNDHASGSGSSCYVPARNTIILRGWSVTT